MDKEALKDLAFRALHSFWQGFVAFWALSDFVLVKSVLAGAAMAGLSAVKTFLVKRFA